MKSNLNLFIGLLSLFVLSNCKVDHNRIIKYKDVSIKIEEYKNAQYSFSIDYPADWDIVPGNKDIILALQMSNADSTKLNQNAFHITNLIDVENNNDALNDVVQAGINDLSNSFESFQLIKKESIKINNCPTTVLKCSFMANNMSFTSLLYIIQTPKNILQIGFSSLSNDFTKYEKHYEYIAHSFTYLN
jgi:hypothetical protein